MESMKYLIETEKTAAGWTTKCAALQISARAKTKAKALRAAEKSINRFLDTASAREVFGRMAVWAQENARVVAWLGSKDAFKVLGRGFALRIEILARASNGRSLGDIAREYGVSIQSVGKMAKRLNLRLTAGD